MGVVALSKSRHSQSRFRRSSPRLRFRMFFEPRTLMALGLFTLTWAGFALVMLQVSGKWTAVATLITRLKNS